MNERRKSRLLARVEGQLAFVDAHPDARERHERRVDQSLTQLQKLLGDRDERGRFERIGMLIARSRDSEQRADTCAHWRMLARADCLVWQMRLRHERLAHEAAA